MGNPTAIRLFDRCLGVLLRPAVRRTRRWSFVVTLPAGLAAGHWAGLRPSLEHGLLVAGLVVVLDVAVVCAVALLGARLLGRERRDALLDLVMHPVARRAVVGELRVFAVYVRALARRAPRPGVRRFSYHRGSMFLGASIALLPPMAAEAAVVHLLLPADWVVVKIVLLGLSSHGAVMLVGLALAERVHPHEVDGDTLRLRGATRYRASIALSNITAVEQRRERADRPSGLFLDGDTARLVARGRTDLVLMLTEPVLIERPLGEPVTVTQLAFAADDPAALVAALADPPLASAQPRRDDAWVMAPGAFELLAAG